MAGLYCVSATDCVAVGSDSGSEPMVLDGNASSWTSSQAKQIVVTSGGSLEAVTCTSAKVCIAVGTTGTNEPLVLTGNPATWGAAQMRVIDFSGLGDLTAITCSSSTACVAVGANPAGEPVQLIGDPAKWTAADMSEIKLGSSFRGGGQLTSIACSSSTACVAEGTDDNGQPFTLSGNPATWSASQATQITLGHAFNSGGTLSSLVCPSSTKCIAVGVDHRGQAFTLSGDPATWMAANVVEVANVVEIPGGKSFRSHGNLTAIACTSVTDCTAVGQDSNSQPFELSGNPSTWSSAKGVELTLGRAFGAGGVLSAVSCVADAACVAVGNDVLQLPLSITIKPTSRVVNQVQLTGAALGATGMVSSLSCAAATSCVAVGSNYASWPLVLRGSPSAWSDAHVSQLTLESFTSFTSVDCPSSTECVVVGTGSNSQPIVLQGNPAAWSVSDIKALTLGKAYGSGGQFNGVTCAASTLCVAVGSDTAGQPIVLRGDPSNWTASEVKPVTLGASFDKGGSLNAVTCASTTECVAVGSDSADDGLVLSGNPASWSSTNVKALVLSKSLGTTGDLNAVTCTSITSCVTVGEDGKSDPLVLVGDPATWGAAQAFSVAVPPPAPGAVSGYTLGGVDTHGSFSSVSCSSATQCFAVGGDGSGAPLVIQGNPAKWDGQTIERPVGGSAFDMGNFGASACVGSVCYVAGRTTGGVYVAKL